MDVSALGLAFMRRDGLYVRKRFNGHMQLFQHIAVLEKKAGVLSRRGRKQYDHMARKLLVTDKEMAERVVDCLSESVHFEYTVPKKE